MKTVIDTYRKNILNETLNSVENLTFRIAKILPLLNKWDLGKKEKNTLPSLMNARSIILYQEVRTVFLWVAQYHTLYPYMHNLFVDPLQNIKTVIFSHSV